MTYSLLPENASKLERAFERAFLDLLGEIEAPFPQLLDPEQTPAEFLPYLANDRGVGEWESTAADAEKRRTVASAWPTARLAGTGKALKRAVESLGLTAEIVPWHKATPVGAPYSFQVVALATGRLGEDTQSRLGRRLDMAKAERDVLSLTIASEVRGRLYYGASLSTGSTTTVYPYQERESEVQGLLYYAAAMTATSTTTVYPQ
tara:strand:- start:246 stop:860 length:615 start_codon:yes stop_codon:yes gene_type:complete